MIRLALAFLTAALAIASGADPDSKALLSRVRSKILQNARTAPRYVCRQEIERQDFQLTREKTPLPFDKPAEMCALLGAQTPASSTRLKRTTSDRAKLDVMLTARGELFSWPGDSSFTAKTPGDLIGGGFSGNGDFAAFLIDIFAPRDVHFADLGPCDSPDCVRFSYEVPQDVSRYVVTAAKNQATVAFHGTVDVNRQSADVIQLSVTAADLQKWLDSACETRERMTYAARKQAGDFIVPQSSESEFLSTDGSYSVNRISYLGCRRYTTESVLSFDGQRPAASTQPANPAALPAKGTELRLRLKSIVDSETSFAGDALEAILDRPVRDAQGDLIPAGTLVRGHLAQLKKLYGSRTQLEIAVRFDALVLGGAPVPIALQANGRMDDRGRAVFRFNGDRLAVGQEFVSVWHVR